MSAEQVAFIRVYILYPMKKYIPYLAIGILAVGFYWYRYIRAPHIEFKPGQAEAFSVTADGITGIQGPAIVHFYASWCGPCMGEMPALEALAAEAGRQGITLVLVTDDEQAKIDVMKARYPSLTDIRSIPSLKDVGVYSIPTTFWIDGENKKVAANTGINEWSEASLFRFKRSLTSGETYEP